MMIVIICILVAIVLVFLLVRVNSRALSSHSSQKQISDVQQTNEGTGQSSEDLEETPPAEAEAAPISPADNAREQDESLNQAYATKPARSNYDDLKMKDNGYRQALQNFKTQPEQNNKAAKQTKETSIKDEDYRRALLSMKNKKKED